MIGEMVTDALRSARGVASFVLIALALASLGACSKPTAAPGTGAGPHPSAAEAGTDGPNIDSNDDVEAGTTASPRKGAPSPTDVAKQKALNAEKFRAMNEYGRGLLGSFRKRVYSPSRDAELRSGTAQIAVRIDESDYAFSATFDASLPEGERVTVESAPVNGEVRRGVERQVRRLAALSFSGPYREVVHYLPPTPVLVSPSRDKKHRVVTAQPHKHDLQVSYSVDERDMVMIRGTSVRPQADIVHFMWEPWRGRQLLRSAVAKDAGAHTEYEYDDKDTHGVVLLKRATLRDGEHSFDVTFRYESVEVGKR